MRKFFIQFKYPLLLTLFLIIIAMHAYNLSFPEKPYYDEVHSTKFLRKLLTEHRYSRSTAHPPLWHILTWSFYRRWPTCPLSWRIISMLAGMLLIYLIYEITKILSQNTFTAFLAAFFFCFNCLSMTQARIGMVNSLALLFMLLALWTYLKFSYDNQPPTVRPLFLMGLFLGLALATKTTSISICLLLYPLTMSWFMRQKNLQRKFYLKAIFFLVLFPVIVFFSCHLFVPFLPGHKLIDIWKIQQFNFNYHFKVALTQTHKYSSAWWGWPLMLRPVWYSYTRTNDIVRGIIAIGNPVIFWMLPQLMIYLIWDYFKRRKLISGIALLGFFTQWLFYALGGRLKFFHYIYYAMPFAAIGLALVMTQLWSKGRWGKVVAGIYLVCVLAMFIYWYPLLAGIPISQSFYKHHMWFRVWI